MARVRTSLVAGAGVIAGALVAGGIAVAATSPPASNVQGTVCVSSKGAMRFVKTGTSCKRKERRATVGWTAEGEWSPARTYLPGSVVQRPTGAYVALRSTTAQDPEGSASSWRLVAPTSAGPAGPAGPQGPSGVVGPIVMSQSPTGLAGYPGLAPSTVQPFGHLLGSSGNGLLLMGLLGPESVGGVGYRLSTVEWCLAANATNGAYVDNAAVSHDQPGASGSPFASAVSDATDRSSVGCYTLDVPPLSPRGYSLVLRVAGQTTNLSSTGVAFANVRTTWVAR